MNFNRWETEAQVILPQQLADSEFSPSVADGTFDRSAPWLLLGNEHAFLDAHSFCVVRARGLLADVRRAAGIATWENFEYLYVRSKEWDDR